MKKRYSEEQIIGFRCRRKTLTEAKLERAAELTHAEGVSGHSVRAGIALDLVARNIDVLAVAQAGGWSTITMPARYSARLFAALGAVAQLYGIAP